MYWFDYTMILLIPGIIVTIWAQSKVQSTFKKYSKEWSSNNYTAFQVARALLDSNGLGDVRIEHIRGNLTDHYDPRSQVLRLSDSVYNSTSLASIGVAAHEVGHAIQDAQEYMPLKIRSMIVPVANFGNYASWIILVIGLIMGSFDIAAIGVVLFLAVVLFQLVTLPVEYNASSRAVAALEGGGYLTRDEVPKAKKVLDAAALTYVAALLMSILTLFRFILLALGARRD
ncbi:MAG: zinc metallopeptidase [Clostridia bacterium]|jgi:hypothetical protein|nr:zinc metallopeptidase [Clostridia bacterium]